MVRLNKEDDSLSIQAQVQPTICEVRGVERESAAEVFINPPASFEEICTLWREEKMSFYKDTLIDNIYIDSSNLIIIHILNKTTFWMRFFYMSCFYISCYPDWTLPER